jgi:hypothetical protein
MGAQRLFYPSSLFPFWFHFKDKLFLDLIMGNKICAAVGCLKKLNSRKNIFGGFCEYATTA